MEQLIDPDLGTVDFPGACLRFTQSVFGAPDGIRSATLASRETKHRHHTREMPDVAVPVWFSHVGEYNDGRGQYGDDPNRPYWGDWGHVVTWVPGRGFLSSPGWGDTRSQQWFSSIEEIQRVFAGSFLFWSEDINGLRVAGPAPEVEEEEETDMGFLITTDDGRILMVNHIAKTYWNVIWGLPESLVATRIQWLMNQGAIKVIEGPQPGALLAGYRDITREQTVTQLTVDFSKLDLHAIADAVNDEASARLKG